LLVAWHVTVELPEVPVGVHWAKLPFEVRVPEDA